MRRRIRSGEPSQRGLDRRIEDTAPGKRERRSQPARVTRSQIFSAVDVGHRHGAPPLTVGTCTPAMETFATIFSGSA